MQMLTDCKGGMFIGPCNAILGDEEELIQGVGGLALQEGAAVGPQAADAGTLLSGFSLSDDILGGVKLYIHLKGVQTCFFILSQSPAFTAV